MTGYRAAVLLPEALLNRSDRALFTVQSHGHLFSTSSRTSAIVGTELSGGPYENLPEPVRIYFRRDQAERPRHGECVSWNFSLNDGLGDWSTAGCKFHTTHYDANVKLKDDEKRCEEPKPEGVVLDECWCYHLTHFGELFLDHSLTVNADHVLDIISLVGVSISLASLTAVLITTFAFPKLIQRPGQKTKIQITSNLAVLLLLFLVASQLPTGLPIPARVVLGIAIHYSMLCNFSCMLIAAIMQYRRLIVVFTQDSPKLKRIYVVMAWILPMVPPIVVLATGNYHAYCKPPLYLPQGLTFYLSLGLPLLLVLVCNVAVFVIIARSLYASTKIRTHGDHNKFVVRFRQLVFLFMLLGLSWMFALCQVIMPENMATVFSYLFCLSIAIQGPAYFVFFVIMDRAAIKEWKKLLCSRFSKDVVSETVTSNSRNNEKHTNGKSQSKLTSESEI
ncbi:hypothetical protein B566_EDAN004506 [Ephemera danica]|nr:hypothetical protein B566_EDAN004506 [Ephemera danica]